MSDEAPDERSFTALFRRLPTQPLPLGFRDAVMARIAKERSRRWEWIVAAALALPNLVFLLLQASSLASDIGDTMGNLVNELLGVEDVTDAAFYVDGLVVLSIALLGLAALLVTHALLAEERPRSRLRAA